MTVLYYLKYHQNKFSPRYFLEKNRHITKKNSPRWKKTLQKNSNRIWLFIFQLFPRFVSFDLIRVINNSTRKYNVNSVTNVLGKKHLQMSIFDLLLIKYSLYSVHHFSTIIKERKTKKYTNYIHIVNKVLTMFFPIWFKAVLKISKEIRKICIYIDQPDGFYDGTDRVCRLQKSLYGLKQAGRQWNLKLDETLKRFGLTKSKMDPCIYFNSDLSLIVAIYVDDLLLFWKNDVVRDQMKKAMNTAFKMKDMGSAKVCLNINIHQSDGVIELDQTAYIKKILQRFNMENCNPLSTPSDPNQKLSINMKAE